MGDEHGYRDAIVDKRDLSRYTARYRSSENDLDCDLEPLHVPIFVAALQDDYYISAEEIYQAIRYRSTFNIIDGRRGTRVDVHLPRQTAFDQAEHTRIREDTLNDQSDARTFWVCSPEDIILRKLARFDASLARPSNCYPRTSCDEY